MSFFMSSDEGTLEITSRTTKDDKTEYAISAPCFHGTRVIVRGEGPMGIEICGSRWIVCCTRNVAFDAELLPLPKNKEDCILDLNHPLLEQLQTLVSCTYERWTRCNVLLKNGTTQTVLVDRRKRSNESKIDVEQTKLRGEWVEKGAVQKETVKTKEEQESVVRKVEREPESTEVEPGTSTSSSNTFDPTSKEASVCDEDKKEGSTESSPYRRAAEMIAEAATAKTPSEYEKLGDLFKDDNMVYPCKKCNNHECLFECVPCGCRILCVFCAHMINAETKRDPFMCLECKKVYPDGMRRLRMID